MESATIEENNGLFSYFQTLLDAPNDRLREERLFPSFSISKFMSIRKTLVGVDVEALLRERKACIS